MTAKRTEEALKVVQMKVNELPPDQSSSEFKRRIENLKRRLEVRHVELTAAETEANCDLREDVAFEILGIVRLAASALLPHWYGEGSRDEADLDKVEAVFLNWLKDLQAGGHSAVLSEATFANDLREFLQTLNNYNESDEQNVLLLMIGGRLVVSLVGLMTTESQLAFINGLQLSKAVLALSDYAALYEDVIERCVQLRNNEREMRRQERRNRQLTNKEERLPSPLRVASYCRFNLATQLLHRIVTEQLEEGDPTPSEVLSLANDHLQAIRKSDPGLPSLKAAELMLDLTKAKLNPDVPLKTRFKKEELLTILEAVYRFEDSPQLRDLARVGVAGITLAATQS